MKDNNINGTTSIENEIMLEIEKKLNTLKNIKEIETLNHEIQRKKKKSWGSLSKRIEKTFQKASGYYTSPNMVTSDGASLWGTLYESLYECVYTIKEADQYILAKSATAKSKHTESTKKKISLRVRHLEQEALRINGLLDKILKPSPGHSATDKSKENQSKSDRKNSSVCSSVTNLPKQELLDLASNEHRHTNDSDSDKPSSSRNSCQQKAATSTDSKKVASSEIKKADPTCIVVSSIENTDSRVAFESFSPQGKNAQEGPKSMSLSSGENEKARLEAFKKEYDEEFSRSNQGCLGFFRRSRLYNAPRSRDSLTLQDIREHAFKEGGKRTLKIWNRLGWSINQENGTIETLEGSVKNRPSAK